MASENLAISSDSVYLDPTDCGSTVGYRAWVEEYRNDNPDAKDKTASYSMYACVDLSDCSHKIEWLFREEDSVEKLDRAIGLLQKFRRDLIATNKLFNKLAKK